MQLTSSIRLTLSSLLLLALTLGTTQAAHPQTFTVIHNFTGGQDGANPNAGLTFDRAGNLFGTTYNGGPGSGTVYELTHQGSGWTVNPLYTFSGSSDGGNPKARVIFGPNGTLYGTTRYGGTYDLGTVFNLRPSQSTCRSTLCPWNETVLHSFEGYPFDGAGPGYGDLTFDRAGNIYGTTSYGNGEGIVYELTPSGSGWAESVLYTFSGSDGANPYGGVIFDNAGNLYGTTFQGGLGGYGTVFQLMHTMGWTEKVINNFRNGSDGSYPVAGLIFDQSGNLYGSTSDGGAGGGGTVFELIPSGNDNWTYTLIYSFTGSVGHQCGPWGTLVMDGAGNLYGTTYCDGANNGGNVFELMSNGGWTYRDLYDFTGGNDGGNPICNVVLDTHGNLYGTASAGGSQGVGVAWELTP